MQRRGNMVIVKCNRGLIFQTKYIPNKTFNEPNLYGQNVEFYQKTKKDPYKGKQIYLTWMVVINSIKILAVPKLICKFTMTAVQQNFL